MDVGVWVSSGAAERPAQLVRILSMQTDGFSFEISHSTAVAEWSSADPET